MDYLLNKYKKLETTLETEKIEKTAKDLILRNYMPPFILEVKNFFYFTKEDMLKEYERIVNLSAESKEITAVISLNNVTEIKRIQLNTLLNQYNLLCRLREGEADAWDTINELYEDD